MEPVVDNSTAYGLQEAKSHPEDHPPRAPELGEGAAGMVLTFPLTQCVSQLSGKPPGVNCRLWPATTPSSEL